MEDFKNEFYTINYWDPNTLEVKEVTVDLESIIKNPSGFKLEPIGLIFLNRERKKLGLSQYILNKRNGTYDEVRD